MAKIDYLTAKIKERHNLPNNFFDQMVGPPVAMFFNPQEQAEIKRIILRTKNNKVKMDMLNGIMKSKGFLRLSAGTNRVVYRYLEDPSFVIKVAIDVVGLQDNIREFKNQQLLKPYVCKIFDTTPDGLMATIERVNPITSVEEFKAVEEEVFYMLVSKVIGRVVVDDIGKAYFMNFGIRNSFGIVLLDYPYVYVTSEEKLFCSNIDMKTGRRCTGMIDYDDGFNQLFCRKCGKRYFASDLEDKNASNDIIIDRGGKIPMKIAVYKKDGTVVEPIQSSSVIRTPKPAKKHNHTLVVEVIKEDKSIPTKSHIETAIDKIYKKEEPKEENIVRVSMKKNAEPAKEEKEEIKVETQIINTAEATSSEADNDKSNSTTEINPDIPSTPTVDNKIINKVETPETLEAKKEPPARGANGRFVKKSSDDAENFAASVESQGSEKYPKSKKSGGSKKAGKAYIASPGTKGE